MSVVIEQAVSDAKTTTFTVNIPATNNITSSTFKSLNACNIVSIKYTNISSVSGISVGLSLANESDNAFGWTKTNVSETAQIVITTKQTQNVSVSINVVDYFLYKGRYSYVLTNANTVLKIDTNLLLSGNYVGAGVWTSNPIIETITLPTITEANIIWSNLSFVKNGSVEKIVVTGGANSTSIATKIPFCVIDISTNSVYNNLSYSIQNAYTIIYSSASNYGRVLNSCYDYVNEYLFFALSGGNNGNFVPYINLATGSVSNYAYTTIAQQCFSQNSGVQQGQNRYFSGQPYNYVVGYGTALSLAPLGTGQSKFYYPDASTNVYNSTYYRRKGVVIYTTSGHMNRPRYIDMTGVTISGGFTSNSADVTNFSCLNEIDTPSQSDVLFQVCAQTGTQYIGFAELNNSRAFNFTCPNLVAGHTKFIGCTYSKENNLYLGLSDGTSTSRLHVFDTINFTNSTYVQRYLDLGAVCQKIVANILF